jgi:threonine aldolase
MIDLRSDTVTKPTPAMLAAMFAAPVGDDVYHEDPTANALEQEVADYLGTESAVFMPTGTMANQIAIRLHTQPGDELLCDANSHIILWECGGAAVHSHVMCQTIEAPHGLLTLDHLRDRLRPNDGYSPRSRLVCLENTHNRGGGTVYPLSDVAAISHWAKSHGLAMHLDGARLWNAIVASGVRATDWCQHFDTIAVCFSKGLGTPIGSALAGPRELIAKARILRKLFGGGMRQIGYFAAACRYALTHLVDRLAEDHVNARVIANAVREVPGFTLTPQEVQTNLVWWSVDPARHGSASAIATRLAEQGVRVSALGAHVVRACTHYDVSARDCERAAEAIRKLATT